MLYPHDLDSMFTVGGLPEGITALQRLQRLQLDNCVTEPLARSISQLTQLTSLDLSQDDHGVCDLVTVQVRCILVMV